jgi:G:T/U-mismatch repair DNA glycosylase
MNSEKHPFEPFLPEGAKILFLGSFPPQEHRWCMRFYYPNWINDFWRIVGLIFYADKNHFCIQEEKRFDEEAIRAFCEKEGLAFYDTACEVRRLKDNAADAFLEVVKPTDVAALLRQIPECRTLVTTGQKATEVIAETFGCEVPPVGGSAKLEIPELQLSPASAGPTASEKYFSGRYPKSPFPEAIANPTRGDATVTFWRMPSSSRAYPLALEKKAEVYRRLFEQTNTK